MPPERGPNDDTNYFLITPHYLDAALISCKEAHHTANPSFVKAKDGGRGARGRSKEKGKMGR